MDELIPDKFKDKEDIVPIDLTEVRDDVRKLLTKTLGTFAQEQHIAKKVPLIPLAVASSRPDGLPAETLYMKKAVAVSCSLIDSDDP